MPTLYFGHPIVAWRGRFSPDTAFRLMAEYRVTNTFLFPTALKAMMKAWPRPREHFDLKLRAIMSAGEAVGDTVFEWCHEALGITVNEMFGQTEINYIVGNSCEDWPARPGSMGRAYPGHQVAVIDERLRAEEARRGRPLAADEKLAVVRDAVDEEVLAREAIQLGLGTDDPIVRARLAERPSRPTSRSALPSTDRSRRRGRPRGCRARRGARRPSCRRTP